MSNLIVSRRYKGKIPFLEILEVIKYLLDNIYIEWNGHFYWQIKGSPLGCSLSRVFADVVMRDLEKEILPQMHYLVYLRYVDDTFLTVKDEVESILMKFNGYDTN